MNRILILFLAFICTALLYSCAPAAVATEAPQISEANNLSGAEQEAPLQAEQENSDSSSLASQDSTFPAFLDEMNTVRPTDILEEITYFGQGGGGDEICTYYDYSTPTLVKEQKKSELLLTSEIITCGWEDGQLLNAVITYPNGREYTSIISTEAGSAILTVRPMLSDPEGLYQFELSGAGYKFIATTYFRAPIFPDVYELNDNQILFNNFAPGEKIRLFMYSCIGEEVTPRCRRMFQGWQDYEMGGDGSLIVNVPVSGNYFVVTTSAGLEIPVFSPDSAKMGIQRIEKNNPDMYDFPYNNRFSEDRQNYQLPESDKAATATLTLTPVIEKTTPPPTPRPTSCPGAILSRITVSMQARTTIIDGTQTRVRNKPNVSGEIVKRLDEGTEFQVIGGPQCSDGYTWWQIELPSGDQGWVAEGDASRYFIEPVR